MQVFVMNAGSIQDQAFADPSAVTPGVIAAFDGYGNVLNLDDASDEGAESALPEEIQFVLGHATFPRLSKMMDVDGIKRVVKKDYSAPVKQVTTISGVPTGTAGTALVRVEDLSEKPNFEVVTYEVPVTAAQTAAQIVDSLVAAINGHPRSVVVASRSTNNLVLTAKEFGVSFNTSVDNLFEAVTVAGTTAPERGVGTYEHVRDLEIAAKGTYGEYYDRDGFLGGTEFTDLEIFASATETYDLYVVQHQNNQDDAINKSFKYHQLILAVSTDVTGDLDTFFESLLQ